MAVVAAMAQYYAVARERVKLCVHGSTGEEGKVTSHLTNGRLLQLHHRI